MCMRTRVIQMLCAMAIPCLGYAGAEESAVLLMAKGDYYVQSGRIAEALNHYQRALIADPALTECHYKLGRLFFDQQEYGFAKHHYDQVLENQYKLQYEYLYLDTLFELAYTQYRIAEKVDPGSDQNIHIVRMQECIDGILAAFGKGGRFAEPHDQYIEIDKEYYLARAWYLKARLLWDKNRDQEYPDAFKAAKTNFHELRAKQKRGENFAKAAIKEAECLYFLYRHHARIRERSRADSYQAEAMRIRGELAERANALLADPARVYDEDIAVYQEAAAAIAGLFAGKVTIAPLFQFFKLKVE